MILRKPYAFLIRNFRKINILLTIFCAYIFFQSLSLSTLTKNYIAYGDTGVLESILNLFTSFYFLAIIIILIITGILLFLLYKKEKPIKTYLIVFITYLSVFIFGFVANNYYSKVVINGFDKAIARNMNGFAFILTLPQYVILLLLIIRSIGLDLKSFGFRQDKEFLESEEDREEVEVEVEFNKERYLRMWNKLKRNIKYFIKQNKIYVILASIIILLLGGFLTYRQIFIVNRIYKTGETLSSNYYTFKVNNSYITTKNYKGDTLSTGKSYVIIDLDATNQLTSTRTLDIEKFILTVNGKLYTPTINYNESFSDLGPVFKKTPLNGKETANYFLIFEIDTPTKSSEFLLKYQDVTTKSKLVRIRLKIKDITEFILRDTKNIKEILPVQVNVQKKVDLQILSYEFGNNYTYLYETCYVNNCPIYQGTIIPPANQTILKVRVNQISDKPQSLLAFMKKYGKIEFQIGGVNYIVPAKSSIDKLYKGTELYFTVPSNITQAESIKFIFTIRNNQYEYILK